MINSNNRNKIEIKWINRTVQKYNKLKIKQKKIRGSTQ